MSNTSEDNLVNLHIAEYQALTTRASYWIVLQVGLLPIIPIYLAMASQVWQYGPVLKEVVIWATLAGMQITGIIWAQTVVEQYGLVRYVECYLRPLAEELVHTNVFWGYEPYLIKRRTIPTSFAEPAVAVISSTLVIITCVSRYWVLSWLKLSWWDACGLVVNLALLYLLWRRRLEAGEIRREWTMFDEKLGERLEEIRKTTETKQTQTNP
jgi:hypothetical protein